MREEIFDRIMERALEATFTKLKCKNCKSENELYQDESTDHFYCLDCAKKIAWDNRHD